MPRSKQINKRSNSNNNNDDFINTNLSCYWELRNVKYKYLELVQFNSVQFFIIYVPSRQPQGQLETQHSVDTNNYMWTNRT
jgi:hypothetical protein